MDLTENDLRAAIKALTDVVAPAVDPQDALANEQLRLVVEHLRFLRQRVDRLHERARTELRQHRDLGRALLALDAPCSGPVRGALHAATQAGVRLFDEPAATSAQLQQATAAIAAAVRDSVREAAGWPVAARERWERCVLDAAESRVAFEQAWYLPMGFEPAPSEVPALDAVLVPPADA